MPHVRKNASKSNSAYADLMAQYHSEAVMGESSKRVTDTMDNIIDIR